mmetsp:Transcript_16284/g.27789  ORF Transcript_16284/g.27789 Transcript_16284/m.27789 type:complete len:108 (-) Transcript_16284:173-496(-)
MSADTPYPSSKGAADAPPTSSGAASAPQKQDLPTEASSSVELIEGSANEVNRIAAVLAPIASSPRSKLQQDNGPTGLAPPSTDPSTGDTPAKPTVMMFCALPRLVLY